jgi:hypothetical protein
MIQRHARPGCGPYSTLALLIRAYQALPRPAVCRCGPVSCSQRALTAAQAIGWRALPVVLIAAATCAGPSPGRVYCTTPQHGEACGPSPTVSTSP